MLCCLVRTDSDTTLNIRSATKATWSACWLAAAPTRPLQSFGRPCQEAPLAESWNRKRERESINCASPSIYTYIPAIQPRVLRKTPLSHQQTTTYPLWHPSLSGLRLASTSTGPRATSPPFSGVWCSAAAVLSLWYDILLWRSCSGGQIPWINAEKLLPTGYRAASPRTPRRP